MPQDQEQFRASPKRAGDLRCQVRQLILPRSVGLRFVRDQRSAQLEKDQFLHEPVLPQTDTPSKGVGLV
jgi:hypothetical protein